MAKSPREPRCRSLWILHQRRIPRRDTIVGAVDRIIHRLGLLAVGRWRRPKAHHGDSVLEWNQVLRRQQLGEPPQSLGEMAPIDVGKIHAGALMEGPEPAIGAQL